MKYIDGVLCDDNGYVLGPHFPNLNLDDSGTLAYKWPRGFGSRWDGFPDPGFGDNFIHFCGLDTMYRCPTSGCYVSGNHPESKKQRQERIKALGDFLCKMYPIVHVRKEVIS